MLTEFIDDTEPADLDGDAWGDMVKSGPLTLDPQAAAFLELAADRPPLDSSAPRRGGADA